MKYCSTCGKEIQDAAVICPHCGCPTANYQATQNQQNRVHTHSEYYPALKDYASRVQSLYVFSILALVLCFGIGIIFSIINLNRIKNFIPFAHAKQLNNPTEIAEYDLAAKKFNTAQTLTRVAFIISACAIFFAIMMIAVASQL